jgi:hypothetical protein
MSFLVSAIFFWLVVGPYEQSFGAKRTLQVMAFSLLGGSLPALGVGLLMPGALFGFGTLILGPFVAWAWAMHTMKQTANFFGVMTMKPTTMILAVLAVSLLHFLASGRFMSLAADLGAAGAGILFTELLSRPPTGKKRERKASGGRRRGPALEVIPGGKDDPPKWLN